MDDFDAWKNDNKKIPISTVSPKEIHDYTIDSHGLNQHLIQSHKNKEKISKYHDAIKNIDKITNKQSGHDIHLYSGIGYDPKKIMKKKGHVFLPSYTSLSRSKHIASVYTKGHPRENTKINDYHILHLHVKKTDKIHHTPDNHGAGNDERDYQYESILPRKTLIKIHPEPTVLETKYGNKYHVWHGHIVKQEDNIK